MNKIALIALCTAGFLTAASAQALTIDTSANWDGSINSGWYGSGQSLTVDAVENTLDDISFYFDADSAGKTFGFRLSDALAGGTDFYSTSFTVAEGINSFDIGLAFTPGSTVFALFDYNGFVGKTAHYSNQGGYAGGQSVFLDGSVWDSSHSGIDHRFIANFSEGSSVGAPAVPLPATLPLVAGAFGLMALRRRRKA